MTTATEATNAPTLRDLIHGDLSLGEPDTAGALTVYPVFGPKPTFKYTSFADARNHGATITELEGGASVRDLVVTNPTPMALLLFDGEEVLGAQQNRTLDVTVLAGLGRTVVPVSCVEQGRWDGRRSRETFKRAPQAAPPDLRREKARQVRDAARAGVAARADQGEVWRSVADRADRLGVASPTGAIHDVFEHRRDHLNEIQDKIRLHGEQRGALVAIGGRMAVLDYVSESAVFSELHAPLVQGYALDALESPASAAQVSAGDAGGFLSLVLDAEAVRSPGVALGENLRFEHSAAEGAGLAVGDELLQLTAFPNAGDATPWPAASPRRTRIRRPSGRRQG